MTQEDLQEVFDNALEVRLVSKDGNSKKYVAKFSSGVQSGGGCLDLRNQTLEFPLENPFLLLSYSTFVCPTSAGLYDCKQPVNCYQFAKKLIADLKWTEFKSSVFPIASYHPIFTVALRNLSKLLPLHSCLMVFTLKCKKHFKQKKYRCFEHDGLQTPKQWKLGPQIPGVCV